MTCLTQTLAMKYVMTHNRKVQYMTCLTQTLAMKYVVTHNRKVQYDMSDPKIYVNSFYYSLLNFKSEHITLIVRMKVQI